MEIDTLVEFLRFLDALPKHHLQEFEDHLLGKVKHEGARYEFLDKLSPAEKRQVVMKLRINQQLKCDCCG